MPIVSPSANAIVYEDRVVESKTMNMRVFNGVPQQEWHVTTFYSDATKPFTVASEWRDIPNVTTK